MKKPVLVLLCCICFFAATAQPNDLQPAKDYDYPQKVTPGMLDNYLFSAYYGNGKKAYNLRQSTLCTSPGQILSLKINPAGSSFAVLYAKGKGARVAFYDLWTADKQIGVITEDIVPTSMCYASDAKTFIVADTSRQIRVFDTKFLRLQYQQELPFVAERLAVSRNSYFLAASCAECLQIWNMQNGKLRQEFSYSAPIRCVTFSLDSNLMAVLTADGVLAVYDTRTFTILQHFEALGEARSCDFHPEGKHLAVVTGDGRISVINRLNESERTYVDDQQGGIIDLKFVKDGKGQIYLLYNTKSSVSYKSVAELSPFRSKLLTDELNERMAVWQKMQDGETMEEYRLRVNDETRAQQMKLYEQEIATRMAESMLDDSNFKLGNYNPETNMLGIDFDNMPSVYLGVPASEVADFMRTENLEFRNAIYGLTKNDEFELIYADVYNKATGKTYVFDNLSRQSLDYLKADENFVPLDLVQLSNMDELKLQEIREQVVLQAKSKNLISEHTQISVNAGIVPDVDANGQKILNYKIDFAYNVDRVFSANEDFKPGRYVTTESEAALSMLEIINIALEKEFAQYVVPGKKLQIRITGMADALPITGKIAYNGNYGDFINEPVYGDDLYALTVTRESGITRNDQLAFLRATGVKDYIENRISFLSKMDVDYEYHVKVLDQKGGEFRRIGVEFIFIDAF